MARKLYPTNFGDRQCGKLVKGHKRHILVDTLKLLQVVVNAANMPERAGAILLLEKVEDKFPRLGKIFSDAGYDGADFIASIKASSSGFCGDVVSNT